MSTRCQIGFYEASEKDLNNFQALIYRHSDGYPGTPDGKENGVLADIVPFLKWFDTKRGLDDTEYVSARLLQYLCDKHDEWARECAKTHEYTVENPGLTGFLGYGICKSMHGDINYYYAVYPDQLEVWKPTHGDNYELSDCSKWKLLDTIILKERNQHGN